MKNIFLTILILFGLSLTYGQDFLSDKLKGTTWRKGKVIELTTTDFSDKIEIASRNEKLKNPKRYVKQVQFNEQDYEIVYQSKILHILDEDKNVLLYTDKKRKVAFLSDGERYFRKRSWAGRKIWLEDEEGESLVQARIKKRKIVLQNFTKKVSPILTILCLEEMVRKAYEDHLESLDDDFWECW